MTKTQFSKIRSNSRLIVLKVVVEYLLEFAVYNFLNVDSRFTNSKRICISVDVNNISEIVDKVTVCQSSRYIFF